MKSFELHTMIHAEPERCFALSLAVDGHLGSMAGHGERAVSHPVPPNDTPWVSEPAVVLRDDGIRDGVSSGGHPTRLSGRRPSSPDLRETPASHLPSERRASWCPIRATVASMTVKLVVHYTQPDDAAAFDEHYLGVHGPLVDQIPGLQKWEGAKVAAAADGGELDLFRTAELYFEDMDALQAALGSEQGKQTAADYQEIAPPGSRMFIAAVD